MTAIREGGLLAFDTCMGVDLVDLDDDRWTEPCDKCRGHGRNIAPPDGTPLPGPCSLCWGTGRAFFAFSAEDRLLAVNVPAEVAAAHAPELLAGVPWTRHHEGATP